jgi:hypothetical protein
MITAANAQARDRLSAAAAIAAACTLIVLQFSILCAHGQLFADFHAFYCGGAAVLRGADPYAAASIGACESLVQPFGLHHMRSGVIAPVPFPGYAFALFAPFALMPYAAAAVLWLLLLAACTVAAGMMLAHLAKAPLWWCFALLAASYPVAVLGLGEVAPIALAALCAAALALRAQRYGFFAACLAAVAVLPQVAGPAFLAALIFAPRARRAAAIAIAAIAALDLLVTGPGAAFEYFTRVLPAHARSEIGYIAQYGLTWILHGAGASDRVALDAGELSYAVMVAAGITCAAVLARRARDLAFLAVLPPAFALTGGPFVHYSEITLAFPALVLLLRWTRGGPYALAAAAVVLLCVPWQWIVAEPQLALPAAVAAVFAVALGLRAGIEDAVRCAFGAVLFSGGLLLVALHFGPQVQHLQSGASDPYLAQSAWTSYIRAQGASAGAVWWLAKLPTWLGLICLTACAAYAAANENLVTSVVVERAPTRA